MNHVLILGAGMVVKPMAEYLLEKNFFVTIASRTLSKAEALLDNHPNGTAVAWTVDQADKLDEMVASHDLTVSLLPYTHHVTVAEICLKHGKNLVTTSYVSPAMKALDAKAKEAGLTFLNEIGLDPGIDHMTAQQFIDKTKAQGGEIEAFYSICGALPAPEASDNPLRYRFSWSPKGVVMASNNGARFLKDSQVVELPTEQLFAEPIKENFPGVGDLEIYPNRDSLSYVELYGIPETKTMYRGTFRYPFWCETLHALKQLGLTIDKPVQADGLSYAGFTEAVCGASTAEAVAEKLGLATDSPAIKAIAWLGFFDEKSLPYSGTTSPFEVLSDLMIEKMMLGKGERDMVVMQHIFTVKKSDRSREETRLRLLDFGDKKHTSIAKTVAWPAAIAVEMILNKELDVPGVHIPLIKEIYEPVLDGLAKMGIEMTEETKEVALA
ncbi:saccharopine dehydrogenase (plasmid) [Fulvitalea axinellae]|uniref:Saccharopine dehydrogenase n=1 Tax=Fulvitalea axinellae TaxID=1182444 RepID=A0AAU9CTB6_9BACT|nr:saccharopine dehydrogenase [Fulvitalea axinellae]